MVKYKEISGELSGGQLEDLLRKSKFLGEGATGDVSRVRWNKERAVVKRSKDSSFASRNNFKDEAKILRHLKGTGGSPVLLGWCSKPPALVTSYCRGETYADIQKDQDLPVWYHFKIIREVARQMGQIHRAGVVHNDLKSDNVMVIYPEDTEADAVVNVIDFGLACRVGENSGFEWDGSDHEEYPWMCTQVRSNGVSLPAGDVYSLGFMLEEVVENLATPRGINCPESVYTLISEAKIRKPNQRCTTDYFYRQMEECILDVSVQE